MDNFQRKIEVWKVVAAFVAPALAAVATLVTVWFTLRGELEAQTRLQEAQFLAETGERACLLEEELNPPISDLDFRGLCLLYRDVAPSLAVQRELVAQLAAYPDRRSEILAMWRQIYEAEDWIDRLESALEKAQ